MEYGSFLDAPGVLHRYVLSGHRSALHAADRRLTICSSPTRFARRLLDGDDLAHNVHEHNDISAHPTTVVGRYAGVSDVHVRIYAPVADVDLTFA